MYVIERSIRLKKKYTCLGLPDRPDVFYSIFADPILFFALGSGKNIFDVFLFFAGHNSPKSIFISSVWFLAVDIVPVRGHSQIRFFLLNVNVT